MTYTIDNPPRYSRDEETALYARMQAGDMEAKNLLALSVWQWAVRCGFKVARGRLQEEDVIEAVNVGLAECLNRWDPARGRLTTAVAWSMRSSVGRAVALSTRGIHLPVHVAEGLNSMDEETKQAALRVLRMGSLATPMFDDGGGELGDSIVDPSGVSSLDELERQDEVALMRAKYRWAIDRVEPPRNRQILRMKWEQELTHDQIGERLGVSRARSQQIEQKAKADFFQELETIKELTMSEIGNLNGENFVAGRMPQDLKDVSMVELLKHKQLDDINDEIEELDQQFEVAKGRYKSRREMLVVIQKAIAKRDGVTAVTTADRRKNSPTLRSKIVSFLRTRPDGANAAEIQSVVGGARSVIYSALSEGKGKYFKHVSRGVWGYISKGDAGENDDSKT